MKNLLPCLLALVLLESCAKTQLQTFPADHPSIHWQGRFLEDNDKHKWLFGSAANLRFRFKGNSCKILLRNHAPGENYNYISFVIDGKHTQRIKIDFDSLEALTILPEIKAEFHDVEVYKETEAKNGAVEVGGIVTEALDTFSNHALHQLEFIGNSITAGMSSDLSTIPCDQGKWYDQHNAYESFGAIVSRNLNCDYTLAAYSGLGMYRNWATDFPVMKDVYESVALDTDPASKRYDYHSFSPDVIILCVGANDLSDGDGSTPREAFDSTQFINAYISFIQNIHQHHPRAKFLLLNGPVNTPEKDAIFKSCLTAIKAKSERQIKDLQPVKVYFFPLINPLGCGGHPDLVQQADMAKQIEPVLAEMLRN